VSHKDKEDELQEAVELRVVVTRLYRILRAKGGSHLTASQVSALVRVEEEGPLRLSTLAELEGIAAPTMSKVVDSLCEAGLVERTADPSDGRANLITIDGKGQAMIREARERVTGLLRDALARLPDGDHDRVTAALPVLQHMVEIMRADAYVSSF